MSPLRNPRPRKPGTGVSPVAAEARRQKAEYDFLLDALVERLEAEAGAEPALEEPASLAAAFSLAGAPQRAALALHRSRS